MKARVLLPVLLAAAGCSSVSVIEERENAALAPVRPPPAVYVRLFAVPSGAQFNVTTPVEGEDPRERVGRIIADGMFTRAERWVAPARVLAEGESPPSAGLLVEGKILRADQGSRALRLGIGFGLGRTHLDTAVRVINLDRSPDQPWQQCGAGAGRCAGDSPVVRARCCRAADRERGRGCGFHCFERIQRRDAGRQADGARHHGRRA
jgi:hypothetical protein